MSPLLAGLACALAASLLLNGSYLLQHVGAVRTRPVAARAVPPAGLPEGNGAPGRGLDAMSMLTEEATERGLACLRRFAERLAGLPGRQVRAVATQTLREARNRNAFLARAQEVPGHPIEVISGREEARPIYAGVARLQTAEDPRLVIDIGGRSTEMILGRGPQPVSTESFQIGSVSLSMRFFPEGRFTAEAFRAAQVAAGAEHSRKPSPSSRASRRNRAGSRRWDRPAPSAPSRRSWPPTASAPTAPSPSTVCAGASSSAWSPAASMRSSSPV